MKGNEHGQNLQLYEILSGKQSNDSCHHFDLKVVSGGVPWWLQWVNDLALSLLWLGSLLWRGFDPWFRNFCMPQAWQKKRQLMAYINGTS